MRKHNYRQLTHILTMLVVLGCTVSGCSKDGADKDKRDDSARDTLDYALLSRGRESLDKVPRFGPDGRNVVFSRGGTLWLAPVSENISISRLTPDGFLGKASRPDWAQATNQIAFTATGGGMATLWVIDPDGSNLQRLTMAKVGVRDYYPAWNAQGNELTFVRFVFFADEGSSERRLGALQRLDLENGNVSQLTNPAEVQAGMPAVASDGKNIAFAGQRNVGQGYDNQANRILIMDDDGLRELDGQQGRTPDWSPDGNWIAFESDRDGGYAIYLAPASGGNPPVRLTPDSIDAYHPDWSPNGQCIVFSAVRRAEIDGDGSAPMYVAVMPVPGQSQGRERTGREREGPPHDGLDLQVCHGRGS